MICSGTILFAIASCGQTTTDSSLDLFGALGKAQETYAGAALEASFNASSSGSWSILLRGSELKELVIDAKSGLVSEIRVIEKDSKLSAMVPPPGDPVELGRESLERAPGRLVGFEVAGSGWDFHVTDTAGKEHEVTFIGSQLDKVDGRAAWRYEPSALKHPRVELGTAISNALAVAPGSLVSAEVDSHTGATNWALRLIGKDGKAVSVTVDGASGDVLEASRTFFTRAGLGVSAPKANVSFKQAAVRASATAGSIVSAKLVKGVKGPAWTLDIDGEDGKEHELVVDGISGSLLSLDQKPVVGRPVSATKGVSLIDAVQKAGEGRKGTLHAVDLNEDSDPSWTVLYSDEGVYRRATVSRATGQVTCVERFEYSDAIAKDPPKVPGPALSAALAVVSASVPGSPIAAETSLNNGPAWNITLQDATGRRHEVQVGGSPLRILSLDGKGPGSKEGNNQSPTGKGRGRGTKGRRGGRGGG